MSETEISDSIVNIIGGLALFLYGAQESARFFKHDISGSLREGIEKLSGSGTGSFLLGVLLAAVAQSSAIAISFGVGFVDAGILSLAGSLLMVMGASLGGTLVSIFLSLNIFDYAPILFAGAFFLSKMRNRKARLFGGVMKSITIIFLGMMFLKMGAVSLFEDAMFRDTVLSWSSSPLTIGTAAFTFAAVFQSRSAIIGLGIAMALSDTLPAASALPVALGEDIIAGAHVPCFEHCRVVGAHAGHGPELALGRKPYTFGVAVMIDKRGLCRRSHIGQARQPQPVFYCGHLPHLPFQFIS